MAYGRTNISNNNIKILEKEEPYLDTSVKIQRNMACVDNEGNVYCCVKNVYNIDCTKFKKDGTEIWSLELERDITGILGKFIFYKDYIYCITFTRGNIYKISKNGALISQLNINEKLAYNLNYLYYDHNGIVYTSNGSIYKIYLDNMTYEKFNTDAHINISKCNNTFFLGHSSNDLDNFFYIYDTQFKLVKTITFRSHKLTISYLLGKEYIYVHELISGNYYITTIELSSGLVTSEIQVLGGMLEKGLMLNGVLYFYDGRDYRGQVGFIKDILITSPATRFIRDYIEIDDNYCLGANGRDTNNYDLYTVKKLKYKRV